MKDIQATEEAFSPQKRTSSIKKWNFLTRKADPDPNFHVDADPDPDSHADPTNLNRNFYFKSQYCQFTMLYFSHQCRIFQYFGQHIKILLEKSLVYQLTFSFAWNWYPSGSAGSESACPGCRSKSGSGKMMRIRPDSGSRTLLLLFWGTFLPSWIRMDPADQNQCGSIRTCIHNTEINWYGTYTSQVDTVSGTLYRYRVPTSTYIPYAVQFKYPFMAAYRNDMEKDLNKGPRAQ